MSAATCFTVLGWLADITCYVCTHSKPEPGKMNSFQSPDATRMVNPLCSQTTLNLRGCEQTTSHNSLCCFDIRTYIMERCSCILETSYDPVRILQEWCLLAHGTGFVSDLTQVAIGYTRQFDRLYSFPSVSNRFHIDSRSSILFLNVVALLAVTAFPVEASHIPTEASCSAFDVEVKLFKSFSM